MKKLAEIAAKTLQRYAAKKLEEDIHPNSTQLRGHPNLNRGETKSVGPGTTRKDQCPLGNKLTRENAGMRE